MYWMFTSEQQSQHLSVGTTFAKFILALDEYVFD